MVRGKKFLMVDEKNWQKADVDAESKVLSNASVLELLLSKHPSSHQLQRMLQCTLLDRSALAEPCTIQAIVLAACAPLVIDILGN